MAVDRSYSDYEAIRNYRDRGMMKWGAFATGELSSAQQTDKIDSLKETTQDKMSQNEILQVLITSWTNKVPITIIIIEDKDEIILEGYVSEIINKQYFQFNTNIKTCKILFKNIINIM